MPRTPYPGSYTKEDPADRNLSIAATQATIEALKRLAERADKSRSAVVRELIERAAARL